MNPSNINKLLIFVAIILFSLQMFSAGAKFADNQVANGTIDLVMAVFWGGFLSIEWFRRADEIKWLKKNDKKADEIFKEIGQALDNINKEHEKELQIGNTLSNIIANIIGKDKPNKSHIPKIKKEFERQIPDRYLKLAIKNGEFDAEVSNKPFREATTKKAPAKKASKK